jgi:hypothetical protein
MDDLPALTEFKRRTLSMGSPHIGALSLCPFLNVATCIGSDESAHGPFGKSPDLEVSIGTPA